LTAKQAEIREAFTGTHLKMASAVVNSLQERLDKVDELLESLQEEEWQDEEEGIAAPSTTGTSRTADLSLLDRILAMILGATSKDVEWLVKEHRAIVEEWIQTFGRLPSNTPATVNEMEGREDTVTSARTPPPLSEQERQALRESFGIEDNDDDFWDDDRLT
jgi:hypothetical protein